jgi:ABC-type transport system involved in cytochrome bd biosynthesis fused ATPase/permease subunit
MAVETKCACAQCCEVTASHHHHPVQKDAVFQYEGHEGHAFSLRVPEFTVNQGEVVAVVGRVGAGKSALLQALLGNMPCKSGEVHVGGQIAYVPQVCPLQVQSCPIMSN